MLYLVTCCVWSHAVFGHMLCVVTCCVWSHAVCGHMLCVVTCCVWSHAMPQLEAVWVVGADMSKLKVLEAVIKETLRLHATAPIGSIR